MGRELLHNDWWGLLGVEDDFVTNEDISSDQIDLELLTVNLSGKVRKESMDGRDYLVAPLTMIVPGVLNGSKGALFYPLSEITENYLAWNNLPIVVNHPTDDFGKPCSARSPKILEKFGIGVVFNTQVSDRLIAEGWFDVEKTRRLSPTTFDKLQRGEVEELSTGLFTRNYPVQNGEEAQYNGKPYTHVARNYRPDHLAILPTSKGACSVSDGCGVNVNERTENNCGIGSGGFQSGNKCAAGGGGKSDDLTVVRKGGGFPDYETAEKSVISSINRLAASKKTDIDSLAKSNGFSNGRELIDTATYVKLQGFETLSKAADAWGVKVGSDLAKKVVERKGGKYIGESDLSPDKIKKAQEQAARLRELTGNCLSDLNLIDVQNARCGVYVCKSESSESSTSDDDVSNKEGCKSCGASCGCKSCKKKYGKKDPQLEEEMTDNESALWSQLICNSNSDRSEAVKRSEMIQELIANCSCWEQEDEKALNAMPDKKLEDFYNNHIESQRTAQELEEVRNAMMKDEEEMDEEDEEEETPTPPSKKKATYNESRLTAEERRDLEWARNERQRQVDELIDTITSNERNEFTDEYLRTRSMDELVGLAKLAAPVTNEETETPRRNVPVLNFRGQGGAHSSPVPSFVFNDQDEDMIPTGMDWSDSSWSKS